jgi:rhodanese-related sulfurtransferase
MSTLPKPNPNKAADYFQQKLDCTCGAVELKHWLEDKEPLIVIDVRRPEDYQKAHIPGAINIPREKWKDAVLSKDTTHIIYCYTQTCHLAAAAALTFAKKGCPVVELEGGFDNWKACGFAVEER